MINKKIPTKKTADKKSVTVKKTAAKKAKPKKVVVKAARPAAKNIVKPEPVKEKKSAPAKKWEKVQTAEGWKRSMLKKRKAVKS